MLALEDKEYKNGNLPASIRSTLSSIDLDVERSIEHFADMNYFNHTSFTSRASLMVQIDDSFDFALRALTSSERLLEEVSSLDYAKTPAGTGIITVSEPLFVDESGNEVVTAEVGEAIGIRAEISSNLNQNITFTYLVQIRDGNGFTLSLTWLDGLTVNPEQAIEPSIFWTPDAAGKLEIEVFVWQDINNNPVPLSQVQETAVTVTG